MIAKTPEQIKALREAGKRMKTVVDEVLALVRPGVPSMELEAKAREITERVGAIASYLTDPSGKKVPSMKHHVALVTQEKDGNWSILSGRPYVFMPAPKEPAKKAKK